MKTFYRICLVATVVCSLMLLTAPTASALPRGDFQPEARAESGWLGAAFEWVQSLLGLGERPHPRGEEKASGPRSQTNGSCIDPQGNPKPWCI